MKKKKVIILALLIALTVHLSAQTATLVSCNYSGNFNEQFFELSAQALNELHTNSTRRKMFFTNNLPKPVIQVIGEALSNYTLHTDDVYLIDVNFQQSATARTYFLVFLRITDARNGYYYYFAWWENGR